MQSVQYHIKGLVETFQQLLKGRFLIYFIPGVVLMLLYYLADYFTSSANESLELTSDYSWLNWIYGWINTGVDAAFSLFHIILEQIYIFAVLTLLSPFNTSLAENLDTQVTGEKFNFTWMHFVNDMMRMVFVVFLLLVIEFAMLIGYWTISWLIPDFIDSVVYFIVPAFFFGISFYDFALERYRIGVFGTLSFGFSKPLTMILTGCLFLGIYAIPIIGIPLSPVITVMVSTIVYLYITKRLPKTSNTQTTNNE